MGSQDNDERPLRSLETSRIAIIGRLRMRTGPRPDHGISLNPETSFLSESMIKLFSIVRSLRKKVHEEAIDEKGYFLDLMRRPRGVLPDRPGL